MSRIFIKREMEETTKWSFVIFILPLQLLKLNKESYGEQ